MVMQRKIIKVIAVHPEEVIKEEYLYRFHRNPFSSSFNISVSTCQSNRRIAALPQLKCTVIVLWCKILPNDINAELLVLYIRIGFEEQNYCNTAI